MGTRTPHKLLMKFSSVHDFFGQKLKELNTTIKELKKDNRTMINWITSAETRIANLEDNDVTHENVISDLTKEVNQLKSRMTYLESHSRKNDLVLVGIKEYNTCKTF